jgi:hypothetical protein
MFKRTPSFDYNIRRGQFPGLTFDQYQSLLAGDAVELDAETAEALSQSGYIVPAKEGE